MIEDCACDAGTGFGREIVRYSGTPKREEVGLRTAGASLAAIVIFSLALYAGCRTACSRGMHNLLAGFVNVDKAYSIFC
jgi:hypothetical protein